MNKTVTWTVAPYFARLLEIWQADRGLTAEQVHERLKGEGFTVDLRYVRGHQITALGRQGGAS